MLWAGSTARRSSAWFAGSLAGVVERSRCGSEWEEVVVAAVLSLAEAGPRPRGMQQASRQAGKQATLSLL